MPDGSSTPQTWNAAWRQHTSLDKVQMLHLWQAEPDCKY